MNCIARGGSEDFRGPTSFYIVVNGGAVSFQSVKISWPLYGQLKVLTTLEQQRRLKPVPASNLPLRTPRARQITPKAN